MSERDLWAAVAEAAITDAARMIEAARRGERSLIMDIGNRRVPVAPVDDEIAAARRYFASADWRMVTSLAGLDLDCEDVMRIVTAPGWRPHRKHGKAIQQGAA